MAVCEEHPGWDRRTVAHYYAMYERGESLQPRRGVVAPGEQACQPVSSPIKTGHVASFMVHSKWTIVNGEFILQGTGNYSAVAFNGARHAEIFESARREFELLWEEGRVLQSASKYTACFMYFGEDEDETMYPPGEDEMWLNVRAIVQQMPMSEVNEGIPMMREGRGALPHRAARHQTRYKKKKLGKDLRELLLSVFDARD
uniref:Phospholipase D-like domain-containing protein n=1 Tax=Phytophthora ramorum TaxID=164328 RepID=H3GYZ6_PHYRM